MSARYLLDTNILSDLVTSPNGPAGARMREVGESSVCCSVISAAELRFGAVKRGATRLTERIESLLSALPVLALDATVDRVYAGIRTDLERRGCPIGPNDLFIAAHAVQEELVLVTDNVGEFSRVRGPAVENWRER